MALTRTSYLKIIKITSTIIVVGIIVAYAIWRSSNYARGPHIEITEPLDGSTTMAATTTIKGLATRVNSLTLNGNPILMSEQGNFNETIIIFNGINRLTVSGQDQFGRSTDILIEIVGKGTLPTLKTPTVIPETSTSTATSTSL